MLAPPNTNAGMSSGGSSIASPSNRRHRRLSSLNTVSWPNPEDLATSPVPVPKPRKNVSGIPDPPTDEDKKEVNLSLNRDLLSKCDVEPLNFLRRKNRCWYRQCQNHGDENRAIVFHSLQTWT